MSELQAIARELRERLSTMSPIQRQALAFAAPDLARSHSLAVALLQGLEELSDRMLIAERTLAQFTARECALHRRLRILERSRGAALAARDAATDAEVLDAEGLQLVDAARRTP